MCYRSGHHSTSDDATRSLTHQTRGSHCARCDAGIDWIPRQLCGKQRSQWVASFSFCPTMDGGHEKRTNNSRKTSAQKCITLSFPSPSSFSCHQVIEALDAAEKIPKAPVSDLFTDGTPKLSCSACARSEAACSVCIHALEFKGAAPGASGVSRSTSRTKAEGHPPRSSQVLDTTILQTTPLFTYSCLL